jgi:hypothetical protein
MPRTATVRVADWSYSSLLICRQTYAEHDSPAPLMTIALLSATIVNTS